MLSLIFLFGISALMVAILSVHLFYGPSRTPFEKVFPAGAVLVLSAAPWVVAFLAGKAFVEIAPGAVLFILFVGLVVSLAALGATDPAKKVYVVTQSFWSNDQDAKVAVVLGVAATKEGIEQILDEDGLDAKIMPGGIGDYRVVLNGGLRQTCEIEVEDHRLRE